MNFPKAVSMDYIMINEKKEKRKGEKTPSSSYRKDALPLPAAHNLSAVIIHRLFV